MGLNLRNNAETPFQNLVALFKLRVEKVQIRTTLESEITIFNGKLVQQLSEIFKDIAVKTSIGFHIKLMDEKIEVSTDVTFINKKKSRVQQLRICIITASIYEWLRSPESICHYHKEIEKNIRLLAMSYRTQRKEGTVELSRPNIIVSIDTRNRYF